jgi:hypothetical protein
MIHVGELMGLSTPILGYDAAPYGRTSALHFQERLMTEYHCIMQVSLLNWLHTSDTLTVWKRSTDTTTIVFSSTIGDTDNNEKEEKKSEEDDGVEYRHIPMEERLPIDVAAPCVQHLLLYPSPAVE